jgi:hypothetical protein
MVMKASPLKVFQREAPTLAAPVVSAPAEARALGAPERTLNRSEPCP